MITEASTYEISIGSGFIVGVLLESLSINDNKIIYGISNCNPIPQKLLYAMKKSRESTFIKISGFVCNYTCRMSCDKGEYAGLGHLVKYISFWDGKLVQSIGLDVDASKGRS